MIANHQYDTWFKISFQNCTLTNDISLFKTKVKYYPMKFQRKHVFDVKKN